MRPTFGWNAWYGRITSIPLHSGSRFALSLFAVTSHSKSQEPYRVEVSSVSLCLQCQIPTICAYSLAPPSYTRPPALPVVLASDVRLRPVPPWLTLHPGWMRAVLLHSTPLYARPRMMPALQIRSLMDGAVLSLQSRLHGEIKAASASCDCIHHTSKESFLLPSLMTLVSLFHVQTKVSCTPCADVWIN